jgi:hypothetical protein
MSVLVCMEKKVTLFILKVIASNYIIYKVVEWNTNIIEFIKLLFVGGTNEHSQTFYSNL